MAQEDMSGVAELAARHCFHSAREL